MPGNTYTFAKEITTTTGTVLVLDLAALDEMAEFKDLFTHGQLVRYSLKSANGDIETGVGTYNANNNTFERTQIDSTFIAATGLTDTVTPDRINLQYPSELFGILSSVSGGINPVYAAAGVNVDESSVLSILGSTDIGKGASLIAIRNTPKLYQTATNVEGALAEVWTATSSAAAAAALAQSSANSAQTTANTAQSQVNAATSTANQALSQSQSNATAISQLQTNQSSVVFVGVLQSNTAGQGASTVGIQDAANYYASTNVEGALAEVMQVAKNNSGAQVTQLRTDLASTATSYGASLIGVDNSSNLFNATTVQGVLYDVSNRLAANISATSSNTSSLSSLTTTTTNNTAAINARAVSADLASTAATKGASLIGIFDAGNLITATTVEGALQEVMTAANNAAQSTSLKNTLAGTANGQGAQMIGLYNPDTLISSVDVYHALREIATKVQTNTGSLSTLNGQMTTANTNISTNTTAISTHQSDLASTAAGKGSALVGFNNPQGKFSSSTTVEQALDEAMSVANGAQTGTGSLGTDLASNATGKGASLVAVNNDSALFTGTSTVQSVLESMQTSVNQNTSNISGINTNMSGYVAKTELNSDGAGLGASLVGYVDTNAFYASASLQGVVDVISTHLKNNETNIAVNSQFLADLSNQSSGKGAAKIAVLAGGNFTSTTVQGALNELYTAAHAHDNQVVPAPSGATINQMVRVNNAGTAYELIDAATMRSNLGLGTAATMAAGSFAQVNQSNTWLAAQVIPKVVTTFTAGTNNVLFGNAGVVVCDATAGSIILNLPAASVGTVEYQFIRRDSSNNTVTVVRQGTDTLDGASSQFALNAKLDQRRLISDGVGNWTTVDSAQGNANVTYQVANATANNHAVNYGQINGVYAPLNSPNLTGVPTAPTAVPGTNTTQIATTAYVANATSGLLTSNNPTFSGSATFNDSLASSAGYGIDVIGSINSSHDLLRVQQTSFSQGFTVQYNNSVMVYTFNDGTVTHNAGSNTGVQINTSTNAAAALSLTRSDTSKTVTAWNNGSRWQFSDGIDTAALSISGNAVWHAGNFNPGNYALLTGATFSGAVAAPSLSMQSGSATANAAFSIGRTAVDGVLAVAGTAGSYANDSVQGDVVIRNNNGGASALRLLSGTGNTAIKIDSTSVSFGYPPTFGGNALITAASPNLTGTPTCPTPNTVITTTQLVNGAYVSTYYAPLQSPSFQGTPSAPTPSQGDSSTRVATTAFVTAAVTASAANYNYTNASLELGSTSTANSPSLDFHSSGNNIDYDARIVSTGGSASTGQATLNILSNILQWNGAQLATQAYVTGQGYLKNNQTLTVSGDATGSGTTALALTLANSGVSAGTYNNVTVNAKGLVIGGSNSSYLTGNQTITVSGDASGSGTTSIGLILANSGVAAGTYNTVTVDAKGRVTSGSNTTSSNQTITLSGAVTGSGSTAITTSLASSLNLPGSPTTTTQSRGTNNTTVATTAYVRSVTSLRRTSSVSYAASVTLDPSTADFFEITLTGNITLALNTANATDGQACTIRLTQDGTGGRTVAWGSGVGLGADLSSTTLSTGASKADYIGLVYSATAAKWHVVSFLRGY